MAFSGILGTQAQVEKTTYRYRDTLELDLYSGKSVSQQARPLLVLVHGGGFESGRRDGELESSFCLKMAEKGYLVASISYRLTRRNDPFSCDCDTKKKMESFVKASEDLSDAVHFILARKDLSFDRENLILAGSSAGAETILHSAFMAHDYRFNHIPRFPVSGIISFSGAVSDAAYITKSNAVPALLIHGKKDRLVPYGTAPHHLCEEERPGYLILDGSETISKQLTGLNTSYILVFDPEGTHDLCNEAYLQTELTDRFIRDLVLEKKFVQSVIELDDLSEGTDPNPAQQ